MAGLESRPTEVGRGQQCRSWPSVGKVRILARLERPLQLEEREKRIAALDVAIARGRADVAAGRVKPADEVLKRLDAKYRKMAKSRA